MTIKDQLERLPEPYRRLALENADPIKLEWESPNVRDALARAFIWLDTHQKHSFWDAVYKWADYHLDESHPEPPQLPPVP